MMKSLIVAIVGMTWIAAIAQPGAAAMPATPVWDAFVVLPWSLGVDGRIVACEHPAATIDRGRCYTYGWTRKPAGTPRAMQVQEALSSYLKDKLPSGKKAVLVAVGPSQSGAKYPSESATSFIAYYRVLNTSD